VIDRRAYLGLDRQFDEGHPTVSAIAPLICFCIAFTILVLLRLITIFGAVTARCVETDEFWYSSTGGNWPLAGSFILVLVLLFLWNLFIGIDDWRRSRGTRIMVVVNAIGIAAMLYLFTAVHDSATFAHNLRAGIYDNIRFRPTLISPMRTETECATMRRLEGRWRVVERKVGHYGFNIPAEWIELKSWGHVIYAQDAEWLEPYVSWGRPPIQYHYYDDKRWRDGTLFGAPWEFDLQGDTLTLETPEWFEHERERSRVVLEREAIPDKPVFASPFAASH